MQRSKGERAERFATDVRPRRELASVAMRCGRSTKRDSRNANNDCRREDRGRNKDASEQPKASRAGPSSDGQAGRSKERKREGEIGDWVWEQDQGEGGNGIG